MSNVSNGLASASNFVWYNDTDDDTPISASFDLIAESGMTPYMSPTTMPAALCSSSPLAHHLAELKGTPKMPIGACCATHSSTKRTHSLEPSMSTKKAKNSLNGTMTMTTMITTAITMRTMMTKSNEDSKGEEDALEQMETLNKISKGDNLVSFLFSHLFPFFSFVDNVFPLSET